VRIFALKSTSVTSYGKRAFGNLWTLALLVLFAIGAASCSDVSTAPAPAPGPGALAITTSSLPAGTVSQPYAWTLGGSGGTTPYNWSVTPALPANLQLDTATGTITGTPVAQSSTTYTFSLRDSSVPNQTIQKPLLLTITSAPVPPTITTTSLPPGTVNQIYPPNTTLQATGGVPPYTWAVNPPLPNGLQLNLVSPGSISGIPLESTNGPATYTFTVLDSTVPFNLTNNKQLTLTINLTVPTLTITTTTLPNGKVGTPYSQTLVASGGTPPYTWSVSPALPTPFQLSSSTGTITGTPTATATITRTYTVRDSTLPTNRTASRSLTIRVTN
jgi:hypothetical protein